MGYMPDLQRSLSKRRMSTLVLFGWKRKNAVPMPRAFWGVLSMGITQGMKIHLIADGPDEVEALDDLVALLAGDHAE